MLDAWYIAMKSTNFLIESERSFPSNVIPLWPASGVARESGARPRQPKAVQTHSIESNAVELEPPEQRLARRIERVLCALLYHAALQPGDLRGSKFFFIEKRVSQLASPDRLTAIARAAICLGMTDDLTHLSAAVVMLELQVQSKWRNRLLRPFSARRRQINNDTLAIACLLACDLDALKTRPIDKFAEFL